MNGVNMPDARRAFLEFKRYKEHEWFRLLIGILLLLAISYWVAHKRVPDHMQYEYERLDKEQLRHINRIYFDTLNKRESGETVAENTAAITTGGTAANSDSASFTGAMNQMDNHAVQASTLSQTPMDTSTRWRSERVIYYLRNQFNDKIDRNQIDDLIRPYLYAALPLESISFLGTQRFRVESYFWLVGPAVYFEIVFWSWFGVLASILFNLGNVARYRTTDPTNPHSEFDASEIPYQLAKLLYAPLCTLAIVLGYNYFKDQNIVDISSSKGVIVFAFIGGFYSARLIAFLDRLKEVILPNSGTADLPVQKPTAGAAVQNITISLQPDDAALPPDLKNEIAEMGLGSASVTLQHEPTGELITATRTGEDQAGTFRIDSLKPGSYLIKALWAKEINDQPVNLQAEQKEDIRASDKTIVVMLKKSATEG